MESQSDFGEFIYLNLSSNPLASEDNFRQAVWSHIISVGFLTLCLNSSTAHPIIKCCLMFNYFMTKKLSLIFHQNDAEKMFLGEQYKGHAAVICN